MDEDCKFRGFPIVCRFYSTLNHDDEHKSDIDVKQ